MKSLIPIFTLSILLHFSVTASAQSAASIPVNQDTTVIKIPGTAVSSPQSIGLWLKNNTPNHYEAVKALYYWIGHNIAYDVVLMNSKKGYKDTVDAAVRTLAARKGICQGYCSLFYEVCRHADIPTHLISGYVYIFGQLELNGGHNWIGIKLNNKWAIIDPTWGTGTVNGKGRFDFAFNWDNFLISPEKAIYTHVPFDPVYQFLPDPIKPAELDNHTGAEALKRQAMNFEDSLQTFMRQNLVQWYSGRLQRLENFGIINPLQREEAKYLKSMIPYAIYVTDSVNGTTRKYYELSDRYNKLIEHYNTYIDFENNGMKPAKSDKAIIEWLNNMCKEVKEIHTALNNLHFLSSFMEEDRIGFVRSVKPTVDDLENTRKNTLAFLAQRK
ncbi:MAG: hypothetical protein JO154_09355 [Chitinophaga sp.]|uniref:transglutaminase domain-containing protein n=1 Tax=Chitinophaga sp. TaxID=1869181 RepID=UPI0025BBB4E9|nr:transglutaminase domain-containing protein [Chitinophaga sp.]MBV8252799.1 hypothetical protein [Chitinophaga sp.]